MREGIPYFNPQVDEWDPSLAAIEAEHLSEDRIITFCVTSETYGFGSLAEVGFCVAQAKQDTDRQFIIYIDGDLDLHLTDAFGRGESTRARKLVREHLSQMDLPNLFVVESLEEASALSLALWVTA